MMTPNGILVQDLRAPIQYGFSFPYCGIHAYHQQALCGISDPECVRLSKEAFSTPTGDGMYQLLEFMSHADLVARYTAACQKHSIPIRLLFVESTYTEERWLEPLPEKTLLGYEVCPFPLDDGIITDLDWNPALAVFKEQLNKNGLFSSMADAQTFCDHYLQLLSRDLLGDGPVDAHVCRVYEIGDPWFFTKA